MKNKNVNIKTIVIIVLIGIIVTLISIILNMKNINITNQKVEQQQLSQTTNNNAYVDMQTHLSEVSSSSNKGTIVKVALAKGSRGTYTVDVAAFITDNNLNIDYTKLNNNNFAYERLSFTANTTGSIAQPSYSYDASTGILSINNPYVTGGSGIISNGIPYLYYVAN